MSGFNFDGLKKFQKKMEALKNTDKVQVKELFTVEFLKAHTQFTDLDNFESMAKQAGFKVGSAERFKSNFGPEWDAFIKKNSKFSSWDEMKDSAAAAWVKRQLTE